MKYSKLFGKTRHNPPCDANSVNAGLLTQAGFIDKLGAGIYNFLPLGKRVMKKIEAIVREEMDAIEGQEILMPALHPIEIWEKTGRIKTMDDILYKSTASGNRKFVFGPSHEETVTPLAEKYTQSYKDLPFSIYQIQTKFRDEPRAKSGLLRGREFGMKDMYSFHTSDEDLDAYYERAMAAYTRVYERCDLHAHIIEASGGPFSDKYSHEFSVETEVGEDTIIVCDKCETAQNLEIAEGKVSAPDENEEEMPLEKVDMERDFTIAANAKAHNVPEYKILKTVVYEVEESGLIGVVIRGDLNVSEVKLENYLKKPLRAASPEKLKEMGLVQGYISPVGLPEGIGLSFIGDDSVKDVKNWVTGANEFAKDYRGANLGRDFQIKDFADFTEVAGGFKCAKCESGLREIKAVEVGNIFKLGTRFSDAFGLGFTDQDGKNKPVTMGCYGIGTTRLMGTIVEVKHDEKGIIWPLSVAPYSVHLLTLGNDENTLAKAEEIYSNLLGQDVEVLFDERDERAGVKLNDADLIGIPLRLVVSKRSIEAGGVEWKLRSEDEGKIVKFEELENSIHQLLK